MEGRVHTHDMERRFSFSIKKEINAYAARISRENIKEINNTFSENDDGGDLG